MRCGAQCLDDFYSEVRGKALKGGYIEVIHTHGRNGQFHPHLHVIATSGGYDAQAESWEHLNFLPYDLLRHKWQWHLMTMLRRTLASDAIENLVDLCYRKYPDGLVSRVQRGQVPSQYQSLARYVAKYVVSPPISLRRIDYYNGSYVGQIPPNLVVALSSSHGMHAISTRYPHHVSSAPTTADREMRHGPSR